MKVLIILPALPRLLGIIIKNIFPIIPDKNNDTNVLAP